MVIGNVLIVQIMYFHINYNVNVDNINHKYTKSAGYLKLTNELHASFWICVACNSRWQLDLKKCMICT